MKLLIQSTICENFSPDKLLLLSHFMKYCIRSLCLQEDMVIYIVDNRQKYAIDTTAVYNSDDHTIFVYGKGRSFVDILKSISHEMVHAKQHQDGHDISGFNLHFHSDIEDEANADGMSLLNAYAEVMGRDIIYDN